MFVCLQTVVRSGEPLTRMYLICSGTVAVMNWAGKEVSVLNIIFV